MWTGSPSAMSRWRTQIQRQPGMELIEEKHPDVVITDIEMPYINGLEFAQMLAEEYPQIVVIVLTAHDLFQYAQKSVELGIRVSG